MALSKRAIVTAARLIDAHFLRLRRWQLKFAAEKGCTRSSEASRLSAAQRRAAYPIQLGVRYAGLFIRSGNRKKLYARHPLPTLPPSALWYPRALMVMLHARYCWPLVISDCSAARPERKCICG